jgi:hypothetical protein
MPQFFQNLKQRLWGDRKKKIRTATLSVILLMTIGLTVIIFARYFTSEEGGSISSPLKQAPEEQIKKKANPLSGLKVEESMAKRHPLGVVIENHPDARPQSGLDKAEIVYEAITEGGITRLMAIYGPQDAKELGPVRSARTFFVTWIQEYDGYFAYAGQSKDGGAQIIADKVKALRHTQGYFERQPKPGIALEHTLYTTTKGLYELAEKKGYSKTASFTSLKFKDDAKQEDRGNQDKITVPFSTPAYQVDWLYDRTQNIYKRLMAGKAHKDKKSGKQLTAKNIIVMTVNRSYIASFPGDPTAKGVWRFDLIGSGKAKVIRDGKAIDATWKKSSTKDRTKFYDSSGAEIKFNRGVFWYEVIPPEVSVKITQKETPEEFSANP